MNRETPTTRTAKALMMGVLLSAALTGCSTVYGDPATSYKPVLGPFRPVVVSESTPAPSMTPSPVPDVETPSLRVTPQQPKVSVRLAGRASWYAYVAGQAAAGPALRAALGPDWRGSRVTVCAATCITLRLTDWCQCWKGTPQERLIDLDIRSFAALAPVSRGIIRVTIRW